MLTRGKHNEGCALGATDEFIDFPRLIDIPRDRTAAEVVGPRGANETLSERCLQDGFGALGPLSLLALRWGFRWGQCDGRGGEVQGFYGERLLRELWAACRTFGRPPVGDFRNR